LIAQVEEAGVCSAVDVLKDKTHMCAYEKCQLYRYGFFQNSSSHSVFIAWTPS